MRHQPGVRPRPAELQLRAPGLRQVVDEEVELGYVGGHQDQALLHRARLERQQAEHRLGIPRVAAQPPHRLGGVGDHAALAHHSRRLLHPPLPDHAHLCVQGNCRAVYPLMGAMAVRLDERAARRA
ncbi:hypothetical protein D9M71_606570 [compost metagenome]